MIKINLVAERKPTKAKGPGLLSGLTLGTNINNYLVAGLLVAGLAVVGVTYWRLSSRLSALRAEVAENQAEYDRLKPIIAEVERFKVNNEELKRKIKVIEDLKANQHGPVRLMDEVSSALPDLLWLERVDLKGDIIAVDGKALNPPAVANFLENLKRVPSFQEPKVTSITAATAGAANLYNFQLSFVFANLDRTQFEPAGAPAGGAAAPATAPAPAAPAAGN